MIKKICIGIVLLIFCSLTTSTFAQNSNLNIDTLNFEYEGPIQEHHKLVVRNLSKLSILLEGRCQNLDHRQKTFYEYPLVESFLKRITILVGEKYKLPSYSTKVYLQNAYGKTEAAYRINKGFGTFFSTAGKYLSENYLDAVIFLVCNFGYYDDMISKVENDLKDEQLSKLIADASVYGIKKVATVDGFYNKKLAKKLANAILFNEIQKQLKSDQELISRIIYVADYYIAFKKLNERFYGIPALNEEVQDEILDIMLKKY